ncbi:competence/damage-inducible protein A [Leptobacterium flavescens]|uniref:CinA-like protein n=1 Tax=Leptobacterium flavescens TaxID=472055 RepID=A0A6P0UG89_9FLAO|nr:competence/damage-inducible protein A [Leptobacterium flavescens]NER12255.1 competence/damage-inducible protein A [Leptobacterium flavescens]
MQAEIITIGDEILIGQIIDTNSAFISKELNKTGVSVYQITSVQDEKEHILQALSEAEDRADIIIITGGLGPTKDDITKHTICEYFNDTLVQNDEVLAHVEELFARYISTPISEVNRRQALVPSKAVALMNKFGTAPGMWLEKNGKVFVSLPGVPYEMRALITDEVLPRVRQKFELPFILHKTVLTYGMGESAIAEKIESWENDLPSYIKLAYLPNLGKVRLRLTAKGKDKELIEKEVDKRVESLRQIIGDIIYGTENDHSIEFLIGSLLTEKGMTLATAESCTGGKIAERITAQAGASAYFKGSVVSYATEVKTNILGVPEAAIKEHSVVSARVAEEMAKNVRQLLKTDFAISTTGNAGPSKGESDAEVGTVFIGIASPEGIFSFEANMGNHREKVINKTANKAFELLQKEILKF